MQSFVLTYRMAVVMLVVLLTSCKGSTKRSAVNVAPVRVIVPEFSKGYRLLYFETFKIAEVYHNDSTLAGRYGCGNEEAMRKVFSDVVFIPEVKQVVCFSTTHVAALSLLNCRKKIRGVANAELVYDSLMQLQISEGYTQTIGKDYNPLYEKIAAIQPEVVFCDGEENAEISGKLRTLKLNVVASRDYFEQQPLARAEWIRFFAFFVNEEDQSDSVFQEVKEAYLSCKSQANQCPERPTVFFNTPYNGIWYMPSGANYMANLVADAGASYVFKNEIPNNGLNLSLSFETVYSKCGKADFWLHTSGERKMSELLAHDSRFSLFQAVKTESVYCGNKRSNPSGGNDWWEKGAFLPHLFLHDLYLIFHRKAGGSDSLLYYRQLHS
ncbi:MAG: ABC transporter substrate-binding protein [Chitinophagales bacterium]